MRAWARERALAVALGLTAIAGAADAQTSDLVSTTAFRVCSDPAAWPASSEDGSGYENGIAELFARELGRPVEYVWYPMSTGFIRNTLNAAQCDVIIGFAQDAEIVLNTNHWMTSTHVSCPIPGCRTRGSASSRGARPRRTLRGWASWTTSSPTTSSPTGATTRRPIG
jgi:hypothetical protein